MTDIRDYYKTLLETTFISAKGSKETICNQMVNFLNKVISHMPDRLYRYRIIDEKGRSIKSFDNGSISLCKAKYFPDKYDSLIYIDVDKQVAIMEEDLRRQITGVIRNIRKKDPRICAEKASKVCLYLEQGMTEDEVAERILREDFASDLEETRKALSQRQWRFRDSESTARIACFTESVQSKFMWDSYAGGYHGFALEYNLREYLISCINNNRPTYVFPDRKSVV